MTHITHISVVGSCISRQVIRPMPGYRTTYTDVSDHMFREKISADATPAGKIADRLYDSMAASVATSNWLQDQTAYDIKLQFEYVTKPRTIQTTINNAKLTPFGVIYVDLTNELLPAVVTQDEEFLLKNNWREIAQYFPQWFQEIVQQNTFQFDMYDKTMTLKRHHALRQAVEVINSANQPVVALGNVYTNRVFDHTSNRIVKNLSFYNEKIPFLKVNENNQLDELINYNYIKEQIDGFYRICQTPKMSPGWKWLNVEDDCYADPQHEWGAHPIHLHMESRKAIAFRLEQAFIGAVANQPIKSPAEQGFSY